MLAELCSLGCVGGCEAWNGRPGQAPLHALCIIQLTQCAAATGYVPVSHRNLVSRQTGRYR